MQEWLDGIFNLKQQFASPSPKDTLKIHKLNKVMHLLVQKATTKETKNKTKQKLQDKKSGTLF